MRMTSYLKCRKVLELIQHNCVVYRNQNFENDLLLEKSIMAFQNENSLKLIYPFSL